MTRPSFAGDATGEPIQVPNHAAEYEPRIHPAAGPWEEGIPDERGRYLVECRSETQDLHFVTLHTYGPGVGWLDKGASVTVLRYAEIYPDDA